MSKVRGVVFGAAFVCGMSLAGLASGSDPVAAEFLGPGNGLAGAAGERNRFGQSFVSTLDGPVGSIDVSLRRNAGQPVTFTLTVVETDSQGLPTGPVLGSASLAATLTTEYEWYTVDFAGSGVELLQGESYAFLTSSVSGDGGYLIETARPGGYEDGEGLVSLVEAPFEAMRDNFIYGDRDILFTVRIGSDDPCPADVNGDGTLNDSDFFAWVTAFVSDPRTAEQEEACDVNRDGSCSDSDFFAWVTEFIGAGCG
ncbi:MAG: GC-type dockerin domain-anchored protein [Planctomycetota bacterium]